MLRGRTDQTIDPKSRIILPKQFRKYLLDEHGNTLVLTNFDNCVLAFPKEEWLDFEDRLNKLPSGDRNVRAYKRFLLSGATECTFDRQGRLLIPPSLKTYANLQRDVVIIGLSDRFEIWDKKRFDAGLDQIKDFEKSDKGSEFLDKLGL